MVILKEPAEVGAGEEAIGRDFDHAGFKMAVF
jgi:hypothetical protein